MQRYDQGLSYVIRYAQSREDLFPKDKEKELDPKKRKELRQIFSTLLDYMRAIDGVKQYWHDFHKFGMIKERQAHSEAFFSSYLAWLIQYRYGLLL